MHFLVKGILLITCLLTSLVVKANSCERWQRILTPHYEIIFSANMAREAQRMANTLETLYLPVNNTLHVLPKRIPIILKNQLAISNGFITMEHPHRGEFFTFPSQNYNFLNNNDWLDLLALHELRHVAQHEAIIPNLAFYMPHWAWLMEGDAVGIETVLSQGGRGRSPYFALLYKVNLLERGGFNYYQQMLGGYKYVIPGHYQLGYFMTTHLKRAYGRDIMYHLLQTKGFFDMVNPFSLYLKCIKFTGRSLTQLYKDTNAELKTLWTDQLKGLKITPIEFIYNRTTDDHTNYFYPQPIEDGIIVLKSGIGIAPQFTLINSSGKETMLFAPPIIDPSIRFTVAKNRITWIENSPAPLPHHKKSYNAIKIYNIQTKKLKTLAYPNRYSYVALSPDGTKLAVFETDESYNHHLIILDADKGTPIHTFSNPENYYYLTPNWSSDGRYIIAIKHANKKATFTLFDLQKKTHQDILPYTDEIIGCPILYNNHVYYNSSYSGIDNIYALDLSTKRKFQVTSSKYGAYNAAISLDGKSLLYNDFGKDGMNAVRITLDPTQWTPIEQVEDRTIRYYEPLIAQEANPDILAHIPDSTHQIKEYTSWKNFTNAKSALLPLPGYYPSTVSGGITIRDLLEKFEWVLLGAGYKWINSTTHTGRLFSRFAYTGWYPIIILDGSILSNMQMKNSFKNVSIQMNKQFTLSLQLPYVWTFREYIYKLLLSTYNSITETDNATNWCYKQSYKVNLSRESESSRRDLHSPWGQQISVIYAHTPYKSSSSHICTTQLNLYFPGLLNHHSLNYSFNYKHKLNLPASIVPKRRQTTKTNNQILRAKMKYDFPITYYNFDPIPFTFLQRLRGSLFYNCKYGFNTNSFLHQIGIDLILDTKWFHIGLRCIYKLNNKKFNSKLLLE